MATLTDLNHPLPEGRLKLLKKGHLKSNADHYEVFATSGEHMAWEVEIKQGKSIVEGSEIF